MTPTYGPHVERLLAVAANRRVTAVAGWRDAASALGSSVHLVPHGKAKPVSFAVSAAVHAIALSDSLVFAGTADGRLLAWDATAEAPAAEPLLDTALGSPVRAIALVGELIAAVTDDGTLQVLHIATRDARPAFENVSRLSLGGRLTAVAIDGTGVVIAGADDGTLWSVTGEAAPQPISAGGEGGVRAICGLGDGRFAAGYGDGSIRVGYLVGAVDAQDRSGDHAHGGAVRAMALAPALTDAAGRELPRRLLSVGEDGTIKSWILDTRRRPRTIEPNIGTLTGVAVLPGAVRGVEGSIGRLIAVSQARKIATWTLGADADPLEVFEVVDSELARLAAVLADAKPRAAQGRLAAVQALAALPEDDARLLIERALAGDPDVTVRVRAATDLADRRASRPALKAALADGQATVRTAAFTALYTLDRAEPMGVLRAAMAADAENVRLQGLGKVVEVVDAFPLAVGLVTDALRDGQRAVRDRAFDVLVALCADKPAVRASLGAAEHDSLAAWRMILARGPADLRSRALLEIGKAASDANARALVAASLDDAATDVREAAFSAALLQNRRLLGRLRFSYPKIADSVRELGPADAELDEADKEPLFAAIACRNADQALRGALGLVAAGDSRAVGVILRLTREADATLRRGATSLLVAARAAFPTDDRLDNRLVWLLDDGDAQVRATAFAALEKGAGDATAELALATTALRSSQVDIRVRALQIVVKHGKGAGAGLAGVLLPDALDDEAADVRREAFRTLWAWNTARPEIPLERGAKSRHADIRGQVVAEIARRRQAKQTTPKLDALLLPLVGDASGEVGKAAYAELTRTDAGAAQVEPHLAAMRSPAPIVRAAGAKGAPKAAANGNKSLPNPLVTALYALIKEDNPSVHLVAIVALDAIAPADGTGFALAFDAIFYELRVRAAELCGVRRDPRGVGPMQKLLAIPATELNRPSDGLRQRAARALADVGDPAAIPWLIALLDDKDPLVREMAARGLATACGPGREQPLVDALAHPDLPVRSWAAEGLAKLGDLRSLPVLAGTQRHDHRPLRIGAIVGFVALGADGVRGLRQGLEDADREVQDLAFAVIVARDAALARAGQAPDLLIDALSASNPEISFSAARLLEARAAGEAFEVVDLVGPPRPDKPADLKEWPAETRRNQLLDVLVETIASDDPTRRYAAAQVQALRSQPLAFWREAARLATPGELVPHTNWAIEARAPRKSGWQRRLVTARTAVAAVVAPESSELARIAVLFRATGGPEPVPVPPRGYDAAGSEARRLVFGAYAGLVRQSPARGEADETHRVRRDAIARLVVLAADPAVGRGAVLAVLAHALRDAHHLVRQAAMGGLRALHPAGALEPLAQALTSAADVGRAAIDELLALALAGNAEARALVLGAMDAEDAGVREHAALRAMRLFPAGSVEPHVLAARTRHSDVRLGAVAQLISAVGSGGEAVLDALVGALTSDQADLRFKAAVGLAKRGDSRGVDVLGAFLRSEDEVADALDALIDLSATAAGAAAAAFVVAARLDDDPDGTANREELFEALARIGHGNGIDVLLATLQAPDPEGKAAEQAILRAQAMYACNEILRERGARAIECADGVRRIPYRAALALPALDRAARTADPAVRVRVATLLAEIGDVVGAPRAEDILARLLADRDETVRIAACEALALRAEIVPGATLVPLEAALRGGRRELVLPAAEGLAKRRRPEAFQALLLVLKAGEDDQRARALLALGTLADPRALSHIVPLLEPDEDGNTPLAAPAIEALARMIPSLPAEVGGVDVVALRERIEGYATSGVSARADPAILGMGRAGDERSRTVLEKIAGDRDLGENPRSLAIEQLGRLVNVGSEALLGELLDDDEYDVRTTALAALKRIFPADRTRVNLLALGSTDEDISGAAASGLAITGDPVTLIARLGKVRGEEVRRRLREGLVRRHALPTAPIAGALAAPEAEARAEAAWMAGASADPDLAVAVSTAVAQAAAGWRDASRADKRREDRVDAEAIAWRASLWAARRIPSAAAGEAARAALSNQATPPVVRREAVAWLAEHGDTDSLAVAVTDVDPVARAVAARAFVAAGAERAVAAVRALGSRADATAAAPLVRAALPVLAPELLAEPATRGIALTVCAASREIDVLIAAASARGAEPARLAAIAALGRLGGEPARAALEKILADKSEPAKVRAAAWRAFQRLRRAATVRFTEGQDREKRGGFAGGAGDSDDEGDDGGDDDDADDDDDDGRDDEGDDDDDDDDEDESDDDEDDDDEDDDGDEDSDDDEEDDDE